MTPAVTTLKQARMPFELLTYTLDAAPGTGDYGRLAAEALDLDPRVVFKTLVAGLDTGSLVVAVIPVNAQLNLKLLARAAKARSARLATMAQAQRATGYVVGAVSPVGLKRPLATYLSIEANDLGRLYVSAGKRGLELGLSPRNLAQITQATICALTR